MTPSPSAVRRVLHLKLISQIAVLEDFGLILVLADRVRCILLSALEVLPPLKVLFIGIVRLSDTVFSAITPIFPLSTLSS